MEPLSSGNESVENLPCIIDILSKYDWVKPLTNKKQNQFLLILLKLMNLIVNQINYGWI